MLLMANSIPAEKDIREKNGQNIHQNLNNSIHKISACSFGSYIAFSNNNANQTVSDIWDFSLEVVRYNFFTVTQKSLILFCRPIDGL